MSLKLYKERRHDSDDFDEIVIFGGYKKANAFQEWVVFEKYEVLKDGGGIDEDIFLRARYSFLAFKNLSSLAYRSVLATTSQPTKTTKRALWRTLYRNTKLFKPD